jgi:hypothetical protein
MFNTVISVPFALGAASGVAINTLQKFVSSINFSVFSTGATLQLIQGFVVQPGTGTPTLVATGAVGIPSQTSSYFLRAFGMGTGTVDSAISAGVVNDGTHTYNSIVIVAQATGVRRLDLYRSAGSVTGALVTSFYPSAFNAAGTEGQAGTGGNIPFPGKYTTITGVTFIDTLPTASLGATSSIVTGTTNTTGIISGQYFGQALTFADITFQPPLAGTQSWYLQAGSTGTISGVLRGR